MSSLGNPEDGIVDAALALPPADRAAYLDRACGQDAELRRLVTGLLRAHEHAPARHPPPNARAPAATTAPSFTLAEKPGDRIGHYKLLQQIGEGGWGVVYMAEQEEPVRRRVALKVIKLGMDTRQVIARFEAERQALALMDHPNIAKVLDAGATTTGRPYFVMELVRGIKITEYCDQNNLPTAKRLELFIQVCKAIQHAHQKGVIHRDIKPSNILVTLHDGVPVPKVIDFGIAKAAGGQRLTDQTLFTAFEQFIGTPAYMSPEQAEMSGLDIDTRSDIYSLGVLLYELLTGKVPFEPKELAAAGLDEIRRIIRDKDPVRPSTRLRTLTAAEQTTVARCRQIDPPKLIHLVRGDLDWIVMKCLEKDRAQRYETANGLARDIERHLENQPVLASPPSSLYRLQKLALRNKLAFAAGGAVSAALVIGLGVSTWMYAKERKARQRAIMAEHVQSELRLQAEMDKKRAEAESAKRGRIAAFLQEALKGVAPAVAGGRDTKMLREILDRTAAGLATDAELAHEPDVVAELQLTLSDTYMKLGDFDKAEALARESLRLRRATFGNTNEAVAASLTGVAATLTRQGGPDARAKHAEAEGALREALSIYKAISRTNGEGFLFSLTLLGGTLRGNGKLQQAEEISQRALGLKTELFGSESPEVAGALDGIGLLCASQGKLTEAESAFLQAVALFRKAPGNQDVHISTSLVYLAPVYQREGKLKEAEAAYREALRLRSELYGDDNTYTEAAFSALAAVLRSEGKLGELETLCHERIQRLRAPSSGQTSQIAALASLIQVLLDESKYSEAESVARDYVSLAEKLPSGSPQTFDSRYLLGRSLFNQGRFAEAESLLISAYEGLKTREGKLSPSDQARQEAIPRCLVRLYELWGKPEKSKEWRDQVSKSNLQQLKRLQTEAGKGDLSALNNLAWLLATSEDSQMRDGAGAVVVAEKAVVATDRRNPVYLDTLAASYAEKGEFTNAVRVQKEAIDLITDVRVRQDFLDRLKLYESSRPYRQSD
jgi:serine/threonine protein kinase